MPAHERGGGEHVGAVCPLGPWQGHLLEAVGDAARLGVKGGSTAPAVQAVQAVKGIASVRVHTLIVPSAPMRKSPIVRQYCGYGSRIRWV
jgi:hypothetical protein